MKKELAIITGATSGIGKGLTEVLSAKGIAVLAIGRNDEKLAALSKFSSKQNIIPCKCDITRKDDITTAFEMANKLLCTTHELKYLVHNATVLHPIGPLTEVPEEEVSYQIDVNFTGPMMLTNIFSSYLFNQSRILFMSTGASRVAMPHLVPHCAAKAAQVILAKGYQEELKARGISVGIVEPGIVETPSQALVRSLKIETLPFSEIARKIHADNGLSTVESCASLLSTLLCHTTQEKFSDTWPWQLSDPAHLEQLQLLASEFPAN